MGINDQGWVAGWSQRPDGTRRAAFWRDGSATLLGTLGGPSSTVPWPGLNDAGMIAGISQTNEVDPLNEDWSCELGGFLPATPNLICRGFVWQNGVMRELPTLGGHHAFAAGVNNRGQRRVSRAIRSSSRARSSGSTARPRPRISACSRETPSARPSPSIRGVRWRASRSGGNRGGPCLHL